MSDGEWPVTFRGVTEAVVTTKGPNDRWNLAALGIHVADVAVQPESQSDVVRARTWGRTRTRQNFEERGEGYVQFTRDPVDFVDAALGIRELEDPVLESADAWVRASVEELDTGTSEGTTWVDWRLEPEESATRREVVPTIDRGHAAIVEATVAASRIDVPAYDTAELEERLAYFRTVARRCGGDREQTALERLDTYLE